MKIKYTQKLQEVEAKQGIRDKQVNERKQVVQQLTQTNQEMKEKLAGLETKISAQNQELAKLKLQKSKIDAQAAEYQKDLMMKTEKLKHN